MLFPLVARAGVLAEAVADRARTRIGQGEAFEVLDVARLTAPAQFDVVFAKRLL